MSSHIEILVSCLASQAISCLVTCMYIHACVNACACASMGAIVSCGSVGVLVCQ